MRDAFPGNRIPANRFDAVGRNVLLSYPEPNQPGNAVTGANNYAYTSTQDVRSNNYSGRIDHQLTGNQRLFGRVSLSRADAENAARWPGQSSPGERTVVDRYVHVVVGDTMVLSSSTSLELRGGVRAGACRSGRAGVRSVVARLPQLHDGSRLEPLAELHGGRRHRHRQRLHERPAARHLLAGRPAAPLDGPASAEDRRRHPRAAVRGVGEHDPDRHVHLQPRHDPGPGRQPGERHRRSRRRVAAARRRRVRQREPRRSSCSSSGSRTRSTSRTTGASRRTSRSTSVCATTSTWA